MLNVSVLVLTKNEEHDLPGCVACLEWCDDVVVFDSMSTDRTVEIAKEAGARVLQRSFDGYASQRNAALETSFMYPWVFILDADERPTPELVMEIGSSIQTVGDDVAAFRIRRRDFFQGRWLRHVQASPWYVRVHRVGRTRYEREVNEIVRADGEIVDLKGFFDHFPFSKGIAHWVDKHNVYSTMEAAEVLRTRRGEAPFSLVQALMAKDFNERRYHQKELFYRLPGRPWLKFFVLYVLKRGFLDGRAGYTYAKLQSIYEYLIELKTLEGLR